MGPADLSVAYGYEHQTSAELEAAFATVGASAQAAGVAHMTFVGGAKQAAALRKNGVTMFFVGSEQSWLRDAATAVAGSVRAAL